MHRDPRVLLADVEQASTDIALFTEGLTREAYLRDMLIQAAVERKFEIIGEALKRLHRDHSEIARRIPRLRQVVDFRNLLIHGYDQVIPERVWSYTRHDLPELRLVVQALLSELNPSDV